MKTNPNDTYLFDLKRCTEGILRFLPNEEIYWR